MNAMQEIRQGESQTREFKFRVDSQRKIAKTLVAFANTDGGTIYIGVKDNGVVAGVRGEEELYMIEGAADLHTRPPVPYTAEALDVDGKVILAIHVPKSTNPPHEAREEDADGTRAWTAYFRQGAANFRANGVLMEYWRTVEVAKSLGESDQAVLAVLRDVVDSCSVSQIIKMSGLSSKTVEQALATLIAWDAVAFEGGDRGVRFALKLES
jgi:predicted HTH transcriptional regulator